VLLNGSALNVPSLKSLGLPRWRLSIGWDRWLELRWLERVSERVSPKAGVLPHWSGMVHGAGPLLTVYFGAPSMFITLWFGFDYGTNPPLGTLII
jgi:hypothetical protein